MNKEQLKNLYTIYPCLEKINQKTQRQVESTIGFRQLVQGEYIKTDSSKCSDLILVLKGQLKIEKINEEGRQISLYTLGEGEICHEALSCYMKCEPLNIVGYALTNLEVAIIPMNIANDYILNDVEFIKFTYIHLYHKLKKLVLDKEEMIHETIPNRLIKYLKSKNTPIIYMTHQEIALDLGTVREVVSRW